MVEHLPADEGAKVSLRAVMYRGDKEVVLDGNELEKVKVEAVVAEHLRGPKVRIFKYKPKKGYRRRAGHRQELTRLEVTDVRLLTRKPAAKAEAKPAARRPRRSRRAEAKPAAEEAGAPRSPRRRSPPPKKPAAKKPAAKKPAAKGKPQATRKTLDGARRSSSAKKDELMAHKKGLGSSRNGRDSNPKYLGVKVFAGQKVGGGEIIVRQRGTRFRPGDGTGLGRDHTIFATRPGVVEFRPATRAGSSRSPPERLGRPERRLPELRRHARWVGERRHEASLPAFARAVSPLPRPVRLGPGPNLSRCSTTRRRSTSREGAAATAA